MSDVINVGIAELKTAKSPNRLKTAGLGSCIGVVIYEENKKIAGLAHVMLPDSKFTKQSEFNLGKFGDTAPALLVRKLTELGLNPNNLKAKIAGGAQMFKFSGNSPMLRIGPRNIEAVKNSLTELGIPIVSEDVGGDCGRTIEFDIQTKKLEIKTVYKGISII